jgi:hypothetical protein
MHEVSNHDRLIARCRAEEDTLAEVRCVLRNALLRRGLGDIFVPGQLQSCRLVTDPKSGSTSLVGEWRKHAGNQVIGSVVIHDNGELFAELDVLQPSPSDPNMRVDAVVAFGQAGALHTELRMTPAPS